MAKIVKKIFSNYHYLYPVIIGFSLSFLISAIFFYKYNNTILLNNSIKETNIKKNINSVDIDFILKTNIFSILTEKPKEIPVQSKKEIEKPKEEEVINITNEKFNGKLIGIITGKENLALITFKNKFLLLRKDKTVENITLKKISNNEIIISYQGKNYKLLLDENKMNLQKIASKPGKSINPGATVKIRLKKGEAVAQLRDVNRFMRDVVVFPYYKNKQFVGYKISRIARGSILRKAGLLPGDILAQVNGETINSPQKLMTIFSKINDLTAINLDIIRKGKRKSIFIELEE